MPVQEGVSRFTRVVLAEGPCCELVCLERVAERIAAALGDFPPRERQQLTGALLALAVAYIGGHDPATVPPCDPGA
jgi:hypothetical protein